MKLSTTQWLMIGVGAIVLYYVWKNMNGKNAKTNGTAVVPPIVPEDITQEDIEIGANLTQAELFEDKFHAVGGEARYRRMAMNNTAQNSRGLQIVGDISALQKPACPCWCDGVYKGVAKP